MLSKMMIVKKYHFKAGTGSKQWNLKKHKIFQHNLVFVYIK